MALGTSAMEDKNSLEEMHDSVDFKSQKKYFMRLTMDASNALRTAYSYGIIAQSFSMNSLAIQSTDDLDQSIMACSFLFDQGLINPIKRELRYLIESSVKYLYIDQKSEGSTLENKLTLLDGMNSSIDVRSDVHLDAFHKEDAKLFINELYDTYRQCCAYIHVSPKQVKERLAQRDRGGALGYETTAELRSLNKLVFRTYDIVLALYFHAYSLPLSGDLFINYLDGIEKWSFHKGKYMSIFSAYFDYKHERNMKKYGKSKSWDFENWPPKRLGNA